MNEPINVLYFVDRMLRGGIQSLVIDWVSRFDKSKIHVDFLLLDDGNKYELEDYIKELGCNVYKMDSIWIRKPTDFIKEAKALETFFKEHHDYKVVHMHSSSKNYMVLKYAKKYGIPIRISHSHASDFQSSFFVKKMVGNILKPKLVKYSTHFFACSKDAGKWLFGKKIINSNKFTVIKNGVNYNKFKYDEQNRREIREKYNIKDSDILIGHVGRFTKVKNHLFMVDILCELLKENNNYKLMFIGEGILEQQTREKIKNLSIEENIIFTGYQADVSKYLSSFDIFILPSIYEGLGLVLIEAQANGLSCIATKETIPIEVKLSDNFIFLNLELKEWVNAIKNIPKNRNNTFKILNENGFLIDDSIKKLNEIYMDRV